MATVEGDVSLIAEALGIEDYKELMKRLKNYFNRDVLVISKKGWADYVTYHNRRKGRIESENNGVACWHPYKELKHLYPDSPIWENESLKKNFIIHESYKGKRFPENYAALVPLKLVLKLAHEHPQENEELISDLMDLMHVIHESEDKQRDQTRSIQYDREQILLREAATELLNNTNQDLRSIALKEPDFDDEDEVAENYLEETMPELVPEMEIQTFRGLMNAIDRRIKKETFPHPAIIRNIIEHDGQIELVLQSDKCALKMDFEGGRVRFGEKNWSIIQVDPISRSNPNFASAFVLGEVSDFQNGAQVAVSKPSFNWKLKENWEKFELSFSFLRFKTTSHRTINDYHFPLDQQKLRILNNEAGVIWGPPGTGKSTTITTLARYLIANDKKVLVLAYNNRTIDELFVKILNGIEDLDPSFERTCRLGSNLDITQYRGLGTALGIPDQDVDDYLEAKSRLSLESQTLSFEEKRQLRSQLIHTQIEVSEAQKAKRERAQLVGCTCVGGTWHFAALRNLNFDAVIFDEASQIPYALTLLLAALGKSVYFAGDPKQLEPVAPSARARTEKYWFSNSIFEVIPPAKLEDRQYTLFLDTQYRMHPTIGKAVSELFYKSKLKSSTQAGFKEDREFEVIKIGDLTIGPGVTPVQVDQRGEWIREKRLIFRECSLDKGVEIVRSLHQQNGIKQKKIRILCPYVAQVEMYRKCLDQLDLNEVEVSSIHKAQGAEADFIILDTVLTEGTFFSTTGTQSATAKRLLCVAMSRAIKSLVVIFHPSDIIHNHCLRFCLNQKEGGTLKFEDQTFYLRVRRVGPYADSEIEFTDIGITGEDFFIRKLAKTSIVREFEVRRYIQNDSTDSMVLTGVSWDKIALAPELKEQLYKILEEKWDWRRSGKAS